MKCQKTIIYLLSFLFISSFFVPCFALAIEYGGLAVYPNKSEQDPANPLTNAWFIYMLEPGVIKHSKVDISNTSDEKMIVEVYPVDAVTTKDGAFAPQPQDRQKIDVGAWIDLAQGELSLLPKETKTIDFTIKVPEDVEVGDHMGAIIVQNKEPSSDEQGAGLRITTRVGARIYLTVPGTIIKELEFNQFNIEQEERQVSFSLTLINLGNVRIRSKGEIEIINSQGELVAVLSIPEREVFPYKTITIPIEWEPEEAINGQLTARASVVYDDDKLLQKELELSLPSFGPNPFLAFIISTGPGVAGGFVVAIILAGVILLIIRKKKRK